MNRVLKQGQEMTLGQSYALCQFGFPISVTMRMAPAIHQKKRATMKSEWEEIQVWPPRLWWDQPGWASHSSWERSWTTDTCIRGVTSSSATPEDPESLRSSQVGEKGAQWEVSRSTTARCSVEAPVNFRSIYGNAFNSRLTQSEETLYRTPIYTTHRQCYQNLCYSIYLL